MKYVEIKKSRFHNDKYKRYEVKQTQALQNAKFRLDGEKISRLQAGVSSFFVSVPDSGCVNYHNKCKSYSLSRVKATKAWN